VIDDKPSCRCVLCRDYGDRDQRDQFDTDNINNVEQYGWGVIMIPEDELGPGWAYTVGLWHSYHIPELAMFGLDLNLMKASLNHLGQQANQGQAIAPDQIHHDVIANHPVHLKRVDYRWYSAFFGRAIVFYRRPPFPFLQVVWPDKHSQFPWENGIDERVRQRQPQLWKSPDSHPAGVWTKDL
jgi:hypothetical protein